MSAGGHLSPCPFCQRPRRAQYSVDIIDGHLVETVEPCLRCAKGRKVAGVCLNCNRAVEGRTGWALRCAAHKKAARVAAARRHDAKRREERRAYDSRRWHEDAEYRARKRRLKRERGATPEGRAQRRRERIRYALRHPESLERQYRRHSNACRPERAAAKRRWAHEHQTVYVGSGKSPVCRDCGAAVPFPGRGRPHVRCAECDPRSWGRDQGGRSARVAVLDLFEQAAIPEWLEHPGDELERAFAEFHRDNPVVYRELEQRALARVRNGATRIGMKSLWEALRDFPPADTVGWPFRFNNNHVSLYARLLIFRNPKLADVIKLRERKTGQAA